MKKIHIITFIILFAFANIFCYAQGDSIKKQRINEIVKNGEGQDFYVCFMMNFNDEVQSNAKRLDLQLFITSDYDASVTIEFPKGNYKQTIKVKAGEIVAVRLDPFAQATLFEMEDVGQAIHITSDKPISVYGLNRRKQTTDSFLAFPVEVLGTEYMIMSYYSFTPEMQSTFAIVATEDNTLIEITPTVNTSGGRAKGVPFQVTLNKGNMYQVGARNNSYNNQNSRDLTGTVVKANKKIAVFGGHQCATVPYPAVGACNVLVEQIPSVNTWGKNFYIGAFESRSFYTYRVLASQDSTKVFEDTMLIAVLMKGQFVQKDSRKNIQITADKPVLVAQYSQGSGNGDNVGDPMMILITPVQQYLRKYRFATPINGEWLHFVNVFVPTNAIGSFKVNGNPVPENTFKRFGTTKYSIAGIKLPYGSHTVECKEPFGLYCYGFGIQYINGFTGPDAYDAYGAMGGQSFLDYQPVPDTIPPIVESILFNRKKAIQVSDDGRDDLGMSDITIVQSNNMAADIPNFTQGAPSVILNYTPISTLEAGSMVLRVTDVAKNTALYTVCYAYDNTTNDWITLVNKGQDVDCKTANTWVLGAFFSHSYNSYSPEFSKTAGVAGDNSFDGMSGSSGIFGLSISRHLFSAFNVTAKLSFITNEALFVAPDSNKHFVWDSKSENSMAYYTAKEINLKHWGVNIDAGLDWKISDYLYLSGGLAFNFNLSKAANVNDRILFPPGYEFPEGGTSRRIADELTSLRTLNLGLYIGPGMVCSIGYDLQLFVDVNYYYYPFSMLDDADLFLDQVNFKFGIKYQLK
ncbi:MAG: IgGFc-binding protein [Ignavibacteria bacterium]|jgi:hypothetical protein|nr:IgGFc-binding protein [Ignavibacteria bacterium]